MVLSAHLSLGLDASDPCSDRKFCGNLTIIFNGAGENLDVGANKGSDPAARDSVKYLSALTAASAKNSQVILLSSDRSPLIAAAAASAEKKMGANFTHIPTSRTSFDQYLNNDTALTAMKKTFESDPDCQEFIRNNPGVDISKFIKVDIVVASHSKLKDGKFAGLPVWPTNAEQGEDGYHNELSEADNNSQNSKTILNANDFQQIRTAFGDSVFHNVSVTCDGTDVAEMIVPPKNDTCSCSVGYTDSGVVSIRGYQGDKTAFDDSLVQPKGQQWSGTKSLNIFSNPMHNYNRWSLMELSLVDPSNSGLAPSFSVSKSTVNHLDRFSLSSADTMASDILKEIPAPIANDVSVKLVSATSDREINIAFREIDSLIIKNKEQQSQYLAGMKRDPATLKKYREEARAFFNNCIFKPAATDRMCTGFKELVGAIYAGHETDADFNDAVEMLNKVKSDFKELDDSPVLEGKNEDPIGHLATYRKQWQNFIEFRNSFTRAARKLGRASDAIVALDQMTMKWATYHSAYVQAYFPDLVKDTLDRRTGNFAKAAELLKTKFIETGDPKYKKMLERLRSQLACVLNFPLGPNYKEVHEFPVGRLIVDATNPDGRQHILPEGIQPEGNVNEKKPPVNSNNTPALR